MIRKITIKDFDHFADRQNFGTSEDLFSKSLSILSGQKWKDMRATLSPAFTGSKMRQMFELIDECADRMAEYFVKKQDEKLVLEMEDTFSRCTNDIIATCAFGIQINSNENRNNEFYLMGRSFMKPNQTLMMIKFITIKLLPSVAKLFKLQFLDEKIDRFFRSLIIETMKIREKKNIYRPDMINLLMQVRKGGIKDDSEEIIDQFSTGLDSGPMIGAKAKTDWDDDYLIAQCLLFFVAGFSTTSIALTLLAYELALNPDVQKKLIEEVDEVNVKTGGKLTYTALQSMKYMQMNVNELLRKWPPAGLTDRVCIKDYKMYDSGEFKFQIDKGHQVQIPIYHIHQDSKYFPDPQRFDPERFSEQNIGKIVPGSYIPFGAGPRSCIGILENTINKDIDENVILFSFQICINAIQGHYISFVETFYV